MCDLFAQTQGIPKMMAVINLLSNGKEKAVTLIDCQVRSKTAFPGPFPGRWILVPYGFNLPNV